MGAGPPWSRIEELDLIALYPIREMTASRLRLTMQELGYPLRSLHAINSKILNLLKDTVDRPWRSRQCGRNVIDLTGQTFGRLTVLRRLPTTRTGHALGECRCQGERRWAARGAKLPSGPCRSR